MNLQPQEPGYECTDCGKGLWASDEWRTWAKYYVLPGKPSQPLCMACAMSRHARDLKAIEVTRD